MFLSYRNPSQWRVSSFMYVVKYLSQDINKNVKTKHRQHIMAIIKAQSKSPIITNQVSHKVSGPV